MTEKTVDIDELDVQTLSETMMGDFTDQISKFPYCNYPKDKIIDLICAVADEVVERMSTTVSYIEDNERENK